MSGTVTVEQLEKLNYAVGEKATSLFAAVIKLHCCTVEDKKWQSSGLSGALCFVIDRELGGVAVFRMYDLNSFDLLFETELYMNFHTHYKEINDYFYCFPIAGKNIIGFSFADSNEALKIASLVMKYGPKKQHIEKSLKKNPTGNSGEEEKQPDAPKKKKGFFSMFGKKKKKPQGVDDLDYDDHDSVEGYYKHLKVSRPENSVLENHIGWDHKKDTFDLSQISREMKSIFKNAGIKKKELEDKTTAILIAKSILSQPVGPVRRPKPKKKEKKSENKSGEKQNNAMGSSTIGRRVSVVKKDLGMSSTSDHGNLLNSLKKANFQGKFAQDAQQKGGAMTKQEEIALTSNLANAIQERRKQITKFDVESEEDDYDWSDDD